MKLSTIFALGVCWSLCSAYSAHAQFQVTRSDDLWLISSPELEAGISLRGYVTGIKEGTFLDKKTGARDLGYGLDIADWIMEPGSDAAYRDQLDPELRYDFGNSYHGHIAKRSIEGPQICTQAKTMQPTLVEGPDFVAVQQTFQYTTAAPGKQTGSRWTQWTVFPAGKRYFVSMQQIDSVNSSDAMFLRIDMPGHIRHTAGDTFSEVYLSYHGRIPSSEFHQKFPPDERFHFSRERDGSPERVIRAYHIRDPKTGAEGPWLAGMTLAPDIVSEAWCHERGGYVCLIEEFGGRPMRAGESFSAAFVVGYFDSIDEMHVVYDELKGKTGLVVNEQGWKLTGE